jgi:predicted nucleotidyltransferase
MFETPNKAFSVTKLKELTAFSNNSLYSGLKTLRSYNVLIKEGKNYVLNSQNELIFQLKQILTNDKLQFKFISTKAFLNIRSILKFLESKEVEQVYLFGSYARGNQSINSDIDIAIFSKEKLEVISWQLYLREKGILVEFHNFTKIDKNNSLQKKIFEEGVLLMKN